MMTTISKMRLVIIVLITQVLGLVIANDYPLMGDAPGDQAAFDGDYFDGPGAMMPLSPSAVQGLLFNADPNLLLSVPSSPTPSSTPLLCRMFPNTVRCLQYRFPFIAPRVDTEGPTPDVPEEEPQQAPSHHQPLSYQYVLLGVPSPSAVHPVASLEPCRAGFNDEQPVYEQQQQQTPQAQQPVNPCPGVQKLPQPSTQNVDVKQAEAEKVTAQANASKVVPAQN